MSNFRFIEYNADVKNIVQQVLDNPNDWDVAGTIKGASGDLQPYGFLPLMMAVVNNTERGGFGNPKNTELQQKTQLWKKYTQIRKFLKKYKLHNHSRAAFFRLKPGDTVNWHIDEGTYYHSRDRYHLSLQGTYKYWVGDDPLYESGVKPMHPSKESQEALMETAEMHIIEPGTFFWFNNKKYHRALNVGDVDRLTFVFDVPHSKRNP